MEERPAVRAAREAHSWLQTLTVGLIALVLLFVFAGQPVLVDGDSMLPTLRDRELMLVRRAGYDPEPGDVVVLRKAFDNVTGPIVKRIIAVGGQTVEIDYAAGTVFVMGYNRNISNDSRNPALGAVEEGYLLGKVELVLFPFANFGPVS